NPWRTDGSGGCGSGGSECTPPGSVGQPFLTLATSCTGPQSFSIWANTWQDPSVTAEASFLSHDANENPVGLTGCERLSFDPTLESSPDTFAADTPAGFTFEVKPATGGLLDPNGLGTADIKNTTVTLPEGVAINPGQAAGLQACQESEAHIHDEGI